VHGEAPAAQLGIVDDVVVDERGSVNELDDGRVEHGAIARVTGEARGEEQHRRAHALAAARLNVASDPRNDLHLRLDVTDELLIHEFEIVSNRLENLRQRGGVFHWELESYLGWNFITAGTGGESSRS